MHEKMAFVDGEILWHGSLNIFSHRATTESMLRLADSHFCADMAKMVTGRREEEAVQAMSESDNPRCTSCGFPTVRLAGRNGPRFKCVSGCRDTPVPPSGPRAAARPWAPRGRTPEQDQLEVGSSCPRDRCQGELVERNGRHGPFLGCSEYPDCEFTRDLEL